MSEMDNRVTLIVNDMEYGGWKSVQITADLERQFRTFKLDITWQWPGQTVDQRIKPGDPCEVKIGKDLVLTGYVFKAPITTMVADQPRVRGQFQDSGPGRLRRHQSA